MKRAVTLLCPALMVTGVMPAASRPAGTVEKITAFHSRVTVPFQVLEVLRDGDQEGFHTERISNGVRVYVGEKRKVHGLGSRLGPERSIQPLQVIR